MKQTLMPLERVEEALRAKGYRLAWSNRAWPSMSWKCHAWTGPCLVLLLDYGADGCELFVPADTSNRIDATIAAIPEGR